MTRPGGRNEALLEISQILADGWLRMAQNRSIPLDIPGPQSHESKSRIEIQAGHHNSFKRKGFE